MSTGRVKELGEGIMTSTRCNLYPPESFDPELGDWDQYMDRIGYFMQANHIPEPDRVPTFLSLLNQETYKILCQLLIPDHPRNKSFVEIVEVLNKYFKPRILIPVERLHFIKRKQESEESIKDFIKALKHLSLNCDYGDGTALDNRMCEQFIYGLKENKIRSRLLTEEKISFTDAVRIATGIESALKGALELDTDYSTKKVFYQVANNLTQPKDDAYINKRSSCKCCGRFGHQLDNCRFKTATCNSCGKIGHISPVCKFRKEKTSQAKVSLQNQKSRKINIFEADDSSDESVFVDINRFSVNILNKASNKPIIVKVGINGKFFDLQLDTGAAVSIISNAFYLRYFNRIKLLPTKIVLKTLREQVIPLGKISVTGSFQTREVKDLELIVVNDPAPCLVGRTWIEVLDILNNYNSSSILAISGVNSNNGKDRLNVLLASFSNLFTDTLGEFKDSEIHLILKKDATPKFFKPRPVPYALKEAIELELVKLQKQGIISPIQHAEWAAPIVVIRKKNNSLRICGDYKVGLNPNLIVDQYPLPVIEDIFAQLNNGTIFTKLDLSQAYQQLKMDTESQKLLTLNTHKGLFQVHRMPFGIAPAPAIFQRQMDQLLSGLLGVVCYLDDILVMGKTLEDHYINLKAVLERLAQSGITLNKMKCEFLQPQVEYLGHIIDAQGLRASPNKIKSVVEAPIPKNVHQLRSFLGLVSYYRKFLPSLSSNLAPLHKLLQKNVQWDWNSDTDEAFLKVKSAIVSSKILTHFNPKLPIILACDASPCGLGAVISHQLPDSSERPIAFASRSLTEAEKNYSQLDKEALGIIFGIRKFHQFLFGRNFTLLTDHKPLTKIFGPTTAVPTLAAARLQRWSLILSAYTYEIRYRPSSQHENADALSRSPLTDILNLGVEEELEEPLLIANLDTFPVSDKMVSKYTIKDPVLSQVLKYTQDGWPPSKLMTMLEPYQSRKDEISISNGCLLWGLRVIIPKTLQNIILQDLHRHHTGIVKMKSLARSYFWWPHLDEDINVTAKSCPECVLTSNVPSKAPIHPWIWPTKPWERIHIDYAGPFMGHNFLVVVDAHSKWPEVIVMKSTSSDKTITALGDLLARFGLPLHLVSDNGTQFSSNTFEEFCKHHGIRHSFTSPYHPASNGQAERFVQTFKRMMKKKRSETVSVVDKVQQILYSYRSTPHTTTGQTPAFLFLGRELRTRLDLLRPSTQRVVRISQEKMALSRQDPEITKSFKLGDKVIARNYLGHNKWKTGVIVSKKGPLTYEVMLSNGILWKRHVDQLKSSAIMDSGDIISSDENLEPTSSYSVSEPEELLDEMFFPTTSTPSPASQLKPPTIGSQPDLSESRRYPQRIRTKTNQFNLTK